jgi:hypothetical protein
MKRCTYLDSHSHLTAELFTEDPNRPTRLDAAALVRENGRIVTPCLGSVCAVWPSGVAAQASCAGGAGRCVIDADRRLRSPAGPACHPDPPRDELRERREPRPVTGVAPYPADVPAQHRVLVPEHQQLSALRPVAADHQDSQADQRMSRQTILSSTRSANHHHASLADETSRSRRDRVFGGRRMAKPVSSPSSPSGSTSNSPPASTPSPPMLDGQP